VGLGRVLHFSRLGMDEPAPAGGELNEKILTSRSECWSESWYFRKGDRSKARMSVGAQHPCDAFLIEVERDEMPRTESREKPRPDESERGQFGKREVQSKIQKRHISACRQRWRGR